MKFSSLLILVVVVGLFFVIQGWAVDHKYLAAQRIQTQQAILTGKVAEIRSPVSGIVMEVGVQEGQRISDGQQMISILSRSPSNPEQEIIATISAPQSGVVSDLSTIRGTFVQSNERLLRIVDSSPDALTIKAKLPVSPQDLRRVKPLLKASVQADYLNGGQPLEAVITSVSPEYDAASRTIDVRLRFLQAPSDLASLTIGVPVHVRIEGESQVTPFQNFIRYVTDVFAPPSNAQPR